MSNKKALSVKNIFYYILIVCLIHLGCEKQKVNPPAPDISTVRGYTNWFIEDFRCGLFVPPSYENIKKYPLIIFLHGYSDTTTWDLGWYNEPIVTNDPCIVLTPKCPKEDVYGWGDSFDPRISPMMAKTFEMISKVEKAFNVDKDRYYIYGSSMGGRGTYGVIQKYPEMFAAAYVECGYVNVEIAPIISRIPIWIFHGSEDPVVPVQSARDLYKAVLDLGGTLIRYTEYKGVGHNVWDYTGKETTISSWLLAQRKGSVHGPPSNVNNISAEITSGNIVNLRWDIPVESEQAPDNKIWYCKIYRNGTIIKDVYNNHNSYSDSALVADNTYEYSVSAINYYFRESELSQPLVFNIRK